MASPAALTRALLFTDLVDSTLLVERLGDARAAEVWAEHDRRARDLLARHRGREIDRADGFFLLFVIASGGRRKVGAIRAALKAMAVSVLITDDAAARGLLEMSWRGRRTLAPVYAGLRV